MVRENTEGLYSRLGGRFKPGTPEEMAIQEHVSTFHGVTRMPRLRLFRRPVLRRAGGQMAGDAACGRPLAALLAATREPPTPTRRPPHGDRRLRPAHDLRPWQFDVVVTENCFGDILSDIAGGLIGGVGLAPSANINAVTGRAMFEPVHGSAPDIAGTGTANPAAAILAGALMLRHLGFTAEAAAVEAAVAGAIEAGECTADAGGSLSTREAAVAVARRLG